MLIYDLIVIGFGKAGKTLAAKMAMQGKKVALIERSKAMYGGTCINIACIPTKTLLVAAEKGLSFEEVMTEKNAVTSRLNGKNYATISGAGVDIIDAEAHFLSNKVIEIVSGNQKQELTAENIVINTGAISNILPIPGLTTSKNVYDSTGIQNLDRLPKSLGILGGGNIGLEFAGLFNKLGSKVTVLDAADTFLPRVEPSIAAMAKQYMEEDGIEILQNVFTQEVKNDGDEVIVVTKNKSFHFDALLYATGRKPNIEPLKLENTDIQITDRGAIQVDKHCQTSVSGVFAVGDVNGGLQFTYVSLDDFRIVFSYLAGDGSYTLDDRKNVPTTMFIAPPLAQIGLTEAQAKEQGLPYATKEIPVSAMPRGHVNADLRGTFKAVVNTETKEILGATIFSQGAQEIINILTVAMDNNIPYTYFTKQIFTHPTLAENLNDLFAI
ncbi:FAD-containing oxidoreductase [Streptococcus constellatus subsp. pharyngis]|uniref:Pyruvate/2-oxoglutarate dehydrogenase complex, dihydrolipoamide dehydrogenase component n=1 Tax=Streptococcus constellatus subsp. pharyngis SK1060 = CCUG 46377 TaxID=1035184 RepID=U2ZGX4_STRCV|nr:FAD-containing oxidoreductase [Streptococcus constellatus]AGU72728.1 pyridine nucleotide-disulfide oxidoreductase [Streptococcus constellatus subsp. pharyngis C232]AGU74484.1 pyridine nucleotide-disulfide oxidoreductase [Streptococcus constellatus subsp. pharyngis C818]AGU79901.1 pyridine nucleotide-disulfide oxidoreductase [Streptococcus constellatus subsp. pharyngis C1050]QRP82159.1 FAD-containing oxidoreductase [Streptococcus constellatus]GAD44589.1 pyruvate/2-oxoglutarate dehydrogenase 